MTSSSHRTSHVEGMAAFFGAEEDMPPFPDPFQIDYSIAMDSQGKEVLLNTVSEAYCCNCSLRVEFRFVESFSPTGE